jgi:hypothetical protein
VRFFRDLKDLAGTLVVAASGISLVSYWRDPPPLLWAHFALSAVIYLLGMFILKPNMRPSTYPGLLAIAGAAVIVISVIAVGDTVWLGRSGHLSGRLWTFIGYGTLLILSGCAPALIRSTQEQRQPGAPNFGLAEELREVRRVA